MIEWDACTLESNIFLRWIECHPGTAGWLQFIGSVLAIIAAIGISQYQIAAQRREEKTRHASAARTLALLFIPDLVRINVGVQRISELILKTGCGVTILTDKTSVDTVVKVMTFHVRVADDLLRGVDVFSTSQAIHLVKLFNYVNDFDKYVENNLPYAATFNGAQLKEYIHDVTEKFSQIRKLAAASHAEMDSIAVGNEPPVIVELL